MASGKKVGRPALTMTPRRLQVLRAMIEAKKKGERLSFPRLAVICGLHDHQSAKRIVRDLERMGFTLSDGPVPQAA